MPTKSNTAIRVFKYGSIQLPDPDKTMSPEQVMHFYSNTYPELAQAIVEQKDFNNTEVIYEFQKAIGTKG